MNNILISNAELEIMNVIWDKEYVSTNDVVTQLNETSWNPSTIMTMLKRLEKKGAIAHKKEGRMFLYYPLILKDDYVKQETHKFINKFFQGKASIVVNSFIENPPKTYTSKYNRTKEGRRFWNFFNGSF